ncbi:MAG: NAD(P)/FAD-dependent oxidoreductase [Candidatus Bathyarchaeia archaeon]|nr:NAD(P)/FAD-dependent oxidoreductase [Candidatus Bathyarchaeota archaeon]
MNVEDAEIAVIGAGPSGLIAAHEASRRGVKVIVLEEHGEIGLPCHCAGLLSISGLKRIGVPCSGIYVLNMIRGVRFFSPSNISLSVEWKEPIACVVDRHIFDLFLAEKACKSGSLIKLGLRVDWVKRDGDKWLLGTGGRGRVRARLLIDAEGAAPKIPRMLGIRTHDTKKLLKGVQIDLRAPDLNPDHVEVYLGRKIAPGFFAWVIPLNEEVARVGLACNASDVGGRLLKFIKRRFSISPQDRSRFLRYYAGLIVACGPINRSYGDALLIVGDSAGHTKPISGGGVIFGGIGAKIAGKVASKAIISGKIGGDFLKTYERGWRSIVGKEIKMALLIRKILNNLSDKDLDKIFSIAIKEGVGEDIIAEETDIDYQATALIKALKWKTLIFLPAIFRALFASIIGLEKQYKIYK